MEKWEIDYSKLKIFGNIWGSFRNYNFPKKDLDMTAGKLETLVRISGDNSTEVNLATMVGKSGDDGR